jgi:hypothetical protein
MLIYAAVLVIVSSYLAVYRTPCARASAVVPVYALSYGLYASETLRPDSFVTDSCARD